MASTNGYTRFFPYDEPFEGQREAMDRIYNALVRGQDVTFEGACGTGKTLAALAPALEHARETDKTVVITTNVHQQQRQFVREARRITEQEPIQAVVFRGKGSMCHVDVDYQECQVLRDATRDLVDLEQEQAELERRADALQASAQAGEEDATEAYGAVTEELERVETELENLQDASTCEYYRANLERDPAGFYQWLYDDVRTPDEIYERAEAAGFCGYELLKDGVDDVDLAICNYHHLLDPQIREAFLRWLDCDPEDVIVVFDEAHNVADAAREHATRTCTENTLEQALDELEATPDPRSDAAANVLAPFLAALRETYDENLGFGDVGEHWSDVAIDNDDRRDDLTLAFLQAYSGRGVEDDIEDALALGEELDSEYEEAFREGEASERQECQTLQAARFVDAWLEDAPEPGYYPTLGVRRDQGTDEIYGRAELYACLPGSVTGDLSADAHATVLMSATLRPFDVLEDVLGLDDPATMAYGLNFPEERRRTFAVDTPPLFSSDRDDPEVQATVAGALRDTVEFTPGNTLAFFPSYSEAERYHELLTGERNLVGGATGDGSGSAADTITLDDGTTAYLDRAGTSAEDLRQRFVEDDHAVLFTSLWGTLTEGVSFDGDDATSVAVVGVPYPHLDDRAKAVQEAYDLAFADRPVADPGWRYAVEIPTVRKTRQALGRVLRSPEDLGVRVLLDRRYTAAGQGQLGQYSVHDTFPPEEREELIDVAPGKLKFAIRNFYTDYAAYDGDPPIPE
ncbi:DNA helicase, Rad3 [Salinarchaeum sp. Harcht-Bsk1]|uniref:ATP-dependent DNA helicase n=1 Tax=Salinarchaeum sp. Harcht-Bsk1 TaxID=1333523 RepID=UPI0003423FA6|nr:ATP-dependent DNA helicase [Salinarchaeum sp. Harcht-Bsk1]AGN01514.1 DNA helicase, Rad3 [Salinarchaeum sp. Harcht-Bsk1]